jgi:hypothetical protein
MPVSGVPSRTRIAFALFALALCAAARADDPDAPVFAFSGFGTLGAAHSSEKNADFTSSAFKPKGTGFSHDWSFDVDSLIAAQVTAKPAPKVSAILQVIAQQNYDDTYRPHVEWANIRYQVTPDLSVRAGRTVLPFLLVTDTYKVGYANPWVRPPIEVYSLVSVTSNDGIDATLRMPVGAATNTFQLIWGRTDSRFPTTEGAYGVSRARELAAFVGIFEQGFATVHFHAGRSRITITDFDALLDVFREFGPEGVAIADRNEVHNLLVNFVGIGASYDPGQWFAMGEWARINAGAILGRKSAWYLSGGYRFGKLTPYVTYAQSRADSLTDPGLTISALPDFLAEPAAGLNAALNSVLATKAVQKTISIGARWDLMPDAALKLQFDHTRIGAGSNGTLSNPQPDFRTGGNLNVFSIAFDFVFR